MERLKALFHINEPERWPVLLGNIKNLLADVGDGGVDVVVLMNGPSVKVLSDENLMAEMEGLSKRGVRFLACRNSLRALCGSGELCIDEGSLPGFVSVVPAGITAILKLQREGYSYIKP